MSFAYDVLLLKPSTRGNRHRIKFRHQPGQSKSSPCHYSSYLASSILYSHPTSPHPCVQQLTLTLLQSTHRVTISTFWSTVHYEGKIIPAWWGWGGGPYIHITYKVLRVYAPAEWADIHSSVSTLPLCVLCGPYYSFHQRHFIDWRETSLSLPIWAGIFKQSMGARNRVGMGYRTGPPGYIGWRNSFLGIDSWAPYTVRLKMRALFCEKCTGCKSTEHRAQRLYRGSGLEPISYRREAGKPVLHHDGSLKGFAVPTARAEMLSSGYCIVLSTLVYGIRCQYFGRKKVLGCREKRLKRYNNV